MAIINELIGDFGRYHLWLCFIVFLSRYNVSFHQMAIIFLTAPVQHYCPGTNSTCCSNPVFNKTVFTRTIVTEWNLTCKSDWFKDLTQTIFQFGVFCGSLIFGIASDKYGRRPTLIVSIIIEIFAGIMSSFLPDYWSFSFARWVVGFANGGCITIAYVMVMEYVGHVNRDTVSILINIPFTTGNMIVAGIGYLIRDFSYFLLLISVLNVILLFYICLLPESPRWLLVVNKTEQAIILMEKVAKINKLPTEHIRSKMELYQFEHRTARPRSTALDLFRTPNVRRNITVMSFIWLVCSYCFYGVSYYISHLTGDLFINVLATGGVCTCASIISIPLIKFSKRKTVVIFGNVICSLCLIAIGFVPEGNASLVVGCLGEMHSYIIFIVIYLYCSEMFPTVVRNAAIGICSMMARVGSMIAPFAANLRPYGKWCSPVAFGIFPMISALLCLLFLPETKNCELLMTLEEAEAIGRSTQLRRPDNGIEMEEIEV
ncbi:organic cation transporter-like protein [Spodoptera frugiperda]|uniref:Organic cation transporter-like protein n=1 Tax=Spodoptera frugiperda TaxID=7108 RepID=A0A9R0DEU7_SPOFR|nr:organic cation transporter-like protein [Spodoptera frugiperda]